MATVKKEATVEKEATVGKKYIIEVTSNPSFCGIDAGGVQFANGKAIIGEGILVNWFKEHEGYTVTEAE